MARKGVVVFSSAPSWLSSSRTAANNAHASTVRVRRHSNRRHARHGHRDRDPPAHGGEAEHQDLEQRRGQQDARQHQVERPRLGFTHAREKLTEGLHAPNVQPLSAVSIIPADERRVLRR